MASTARTSKTSRSWPLPILLPRIVRNYKAEADGVTVESLIDIWADGQRLMNTTRKRLTISLGAICLSLISQSLDYALSDCTKFDV